MATNYTAKAAPGSAMHVDDRTWESLEEGINYYAALRRGVWCNEDVCTYPPSQP